LRSIIKMNTSILKENLKLYNIFNNRGLLFYYLMAINFLVYFLPTIHAAEASPSSTYPIRPMLFYFFIMYIIGQAVVLPQLNLLIKPQFMCLPDSQKIMKRIILMTGLMVMLSSVLIVIPFNNPVSTICLLRIITAPLLGLPFFLLAICLSLYLRADAPNSRLIIYGLHILVIVTIIAGLMSGNLTLSLRDLFVYWIIPLSISSVALIIALDKILGEFDIIRKYHNGVYIPWFATVLNRDNHPDIVSKKVESHKAKENIAEKYFLKWMKQQHFLSLTRSILGMIYQMVEQKIDFESRGKYSLLKKIIISTAILFLTGYFPVNIQILKHINIFFIAQLYILLMPCLVANGIFITTFHELLLPKGRSEHFIINITIASLKLATGIIFIFFIIALSWALEGIMPEITMSGKHYIYAPLSAGLLLWTIVILSTINFFSFYIRKTKSKNSYTYLVLTLTFLVFVVFFIISTPIINLWVVILIFLLITILDIIQHALYWSKRDLV
jgi:hypothetical protein